MAVITAFTVIISGYKICTFASAGASATLNQIVEGDDNAESSPENAGQGVSDNAVQGAKENTKGSSESKLSSLPKALSCSFILPEGFHATETPGYYVNEYYPLESANVTYHVSVLPQEKVLTNAQKAAGESADTSEYLLLYDELTAEKYEELLRNSYDGLYGADVGFIVDSFENKDFDGFPGYLIRSSFIPPDSLTIRQVTAIVLSGNKVFTVVYSRADDDDFEDDITMSLESIHVIQK